MARWLAAFLLLAPALARAQHVDQFRLVNSECPVDLSEECRGRCGGGGSAAAACRWAAFGCDFRICWGSRQHTVLEELINTLTDPAAYALDARPVYGGANFVSLIRLVQSDYPGLYMTRGSFVLEMPALARARQARGLLQWAQNCARLAMGDADQVRQMEASARSDEVYRVTSCQGRVYFARGAFTAERPPAPTPVAPPPGRLRDRVRDMSDEELERFLERSGTVRVDGNRILVDGILPFAPDIDPDEQMRALDRLSQEERGALKDMYSRITRRTVDDAARASPPPAGQTYVYDPYTGRATLRDFGPGIIK